MDVSTEILRGGVGTEGSDHLRKKGPFPYRTRREVKAVEVSGTSWVKSTSPVSSSDKGEATNLLGKDTFLKLFLTELRYQNPLSPADGKTFLTELALFSVVESVLKLTELVQEI
ncbi:MAG TPA: hypothetical protein ENN00_01145, partial [Bacillaceae bacterium]|nr:hypothetical protein [Bacillaceae bacterium]